MADLDRLRENAQRAGKEGLGTHRNAGDAGRVAAHWIDAKRTQAHRATTADTGEAQQ